MYVEIYDGDLGFQVESKSTASIRACNDLLTILDAYTRETESEDEDEDDFSESESSDDDSDISTETKKEKSERIYYLIN